MNLWLVGWTPNPSVWNSPQGNRRGSSNLMFRYQKWCCLYFTTLDLRCVVQKARIHEILGQGRSGLCILKELAKWRIICFKRDGALHGVEISRWQITPQRYCSMLPFVDFFLSARQRYLPPVVIKVRRRKSSEFYWGHLGLFLFLEREKVMVPMFQQELYLLNHLLSGWDERS